MDKLRDGPRIAVGRCCHSRSCNADRIFGVTTGNETIKQLVT